MYRKQKVCLVGLSFALFLLLISTATPGATTSIVEFSAIEYPQPQFSNSLVNLPPPPGMVSYWEFNEGNGGLAADSVGRNDGTLRDGGIWVPGVAGAALDLAPRAYVDCGGDISLTIDDSLTIEAWVLLPNPYGIRTIVQNGANPTNKMYHFAIEDGFLYFDRFDGTTSPANVVRSHLRVTPGEWHHVVVLMDAVGHSVTFYVDGDMDTIGGFFDPYTGVPYSRFIIGYGQDPMTGHSPTFFNGLIDEVAVYAALLSDENIQQHYQNGLNGLGYLEGGIEPPAIEATDDSYTTDEDVLLDVSAPGVLANDIGDGITAILEAGPLAGSLTLNGDGSFEYIPVPDFNGVDTFIYSVSDGFEESNNATVTITVNAVNDAPVGVDDGYTIDEDTSLDLAAPGILENDYDVDGDALLAALIDAPLHGAVVLNADGSLSYVPDADWHGTDSLTYQVFDGTDYSGLVTVTVEVEPVGDAPRAQDDSYTTEENIPLIIDALSGVLVNDSDPDDDLLASQIITFPSHGSLDFNVDGSFTYTPDPDWYGVDSFVYEALDGIFTDTATVTITVLPANKPPVASDDFYTTNEDVVLDVDAMNGVLANDNDINGDFLTAVLLSGPTHGSLSLNADGSFTYTPDPNWYGTDSFAYEVSDGELTDNAIVIITVNSVNDAPVAKADAYTTDEDVPLNIPAPGILGTDSDIEGSILEALLLTDVSHGILTLFADGSFVYEPNPDFFGIDSFAYTAFDGELESNVATVTITVTAVNDAPVAVDDFYSTDEDTDLSTHGAGIAGVVANDIDADGDLLVAILMDIPIHGSLAFDPDGNFLYIPDADFWGTDWFTYYLYDDLEFSDSATVTITVNPINDAPIADDDIYTTNEDTLLIVPAPGILAGDTDVDGDSLIAVLLMGPQNGMLILNPDGSFEYTPDPDFFGDDFFQYIAYDGELDSNYAIAIIEVIRVNDAPVAADDFYSLDEDTILLIDIRSGVLSNDLDVDGDPLTAQIVSGASHGYLVFNPDGSFTYTPDLNWNGIDSFTYEVSDGSLTNIAMVTITVNPVNDAPVALDDFYSTDEDTDLSTYGAGMTGFMENDYDADGDLLEPFILGQPSHGVVIPGINGDFLYIPDPDFWGTDFFTYYLSDGVLTSSIATVTINVNSVNDAPVAEDDEYFMDEDETLTIPAPGLLGNDYDVDGDSFYVADWSDPAFGYLVVYPDGAFEFIPDSNWNGATNFEYWIFDGLEHSNVVTVTITVNPVNDPPVALDDAYAMDEDSVLNVDYPSGVLANDYDVEEPLLDANIVELPLYGLLIFYPDGMFTYTPFHDFWGVDSFTYIVYDGMGASDMATVTITVNPVNDAPVATPDEHQMDEDGVLSIPAPGLLINDYDIDGDFIIVDDWSDPASGSLVVYEDGSFEFIPDPDWNGVTTFEYWIYDGFAHSNVVTVTIIVNPVDDPPVAVDDYVSTDEDTPINIDVLANDYDIEGDPFSLVGYDWVSGQLHGALAIVNVGGMLMIQYTPDSNWHGSASFYYDIGTTGSGYLDSAYVYITVNSVEDAPVAMNDVYTIDEDGVLQTDAASGVLANDYDGDGDSLTLQLLLSPSYGSLLLNADGSFTYTPDANWYGEDMFEYEVSDGDQTDTATVTITVNPFDDPPVAVDDYVTTDEDTLITIDVLANDYDIEGDSFDLIDYDWSPAELHGELTLVDVGGIPMIQYTPDLNWHGSAWFSYNIGTTGSGYLDSAYVYITVNPVNDAPVAVDDYAITDEDTPVGISVLANDWDVDGDSMSTMSVTQPLHGWAMDNMDGTVIYHPDLNYNGADSFTYTIADGKGGTDTGTVIITVNPVNDAPVGIDDEYTIDEDGYLDLAAPGVLGNDYDVDGDTITAILVSAPYGSGSFSPNGALTYYPHANWHGVTTLTYKVYDGTEYSGIVTVTITVSSVNDAPVAVDDYVVLDEDTSIIIDFMGNDYDVDDAFTLQYVGWSPTEVHGELEPLYGYEVEPGVFRTVLRYTPDADWYGSSSSISYGIRDSFDAQASAKIYITVNPMDDAPVAVDDYVVTDEDTPIIIDVMANDYDVDGDPFDIFAYGYSFAEIHGQLSLVIVDGRRMFRFVPEPNYHGPAKFHYTIHTTGVTGSIPIDNGNVYITVNPVNDAPVAVDDFYIINEDTILEIDVSAGVLSNDTDVEGDALSVQLVSGPSHGSLIFNSDGSFTYLSDLNWYGVDSFVYEASDGTLTDTATVTITVNPVDDLSVAVDDYVTTDEDTAIVIDVTANDYDVEGDAFFLGAYGRSPPQPYGQLDVVYVDGVAMMKYTPNPNWHGSAWFTYDIYKRVGSTSYRQSRAYVYVTVNSVPDVPVAMDDFYTINEDNILQVDAAAGVLANDSDGDGDALTPALISGPSHGSLIFNTDGSFTYTPDLNWYGTDSFVYEASDGVLTGTATVTITVNPVDDPSVAVDDYVTTDEDTPIVIDVTANDYDVEGDAFFLGAYGRSPPQPYGQLDVVYVDGVAMMKYTPNPNWHGSAWFTYDIYKRVGSTSYHQDRAYVYITVIPVNDAPVGVDDSYTIDEDTSLDLAAPGLLGNDYDVDGDAITLDVLTVPTHGSGSISADGSFSYNPNPNWYGTDSLTYRVFDGTEYSGIVTVTITVNPVNDAPVGVDDEYTIDEDGSLNIAAPGVLSNDYDVDGDTITAILVDTPYGSGSFSPNGALSYYPPADWHGVTTLTYQVFDGTDYSGIVTVTITVNPVNDAPVGVNDSYTIDEDTPLILPAPGVLSNDYDVDGDTLTLEVLTVPAHGSGSIGLSGSFSYTPESNWYGTDSFTYRVYDGIEYSGVVIVTVTVKPINDAPVAVDDVYTTDEDVSLIVAAPGVLGNDHDIDSDSLIAILIDAPLHGSVTFNADGSLNYVPDADWYGVDTLMYQVFDGTEHSNIATVTITVAPVNDAPVAEDDAYTTDEDTILLGDLVTGVLANDFDIDGDIMAASLVSEPSHGILTLNPDGSFSYIPDANWYGVDSFVYEVSDGALTDTATVTITVNSVNDSPVAVDDAYPTEVGVPLIVAVPGVLANDYDIDNDPLEALLIDSPMHGTIVLVADGSFAYAPDACWCGVDTFSYKVFDGFEYSNIALVTLTVIDVTPPVTMVQFTGVEGEYGWYHSDVEVTLTATDDASGVASTVYSLNGFTWIPYSGPFVLSNPGEVTVYYYSTDNAGNVEDVKSATIKIGKPTRSFVTGGGWIYDSGEKGHFAFVVKYKCGVLKGHLIYSFKADGYKYIVKSTHWFGMAIDGNHALLEGNAKIMRYSYETRKWECFGNFYFRVEIWDNGKCKRDIFQIQIFDKSCELFHEAGFDPLGEVHHGSIQIHEHGPKCWCRCWCMKKWR